MAIRLSAFAGELTRRWSAIGFSFGALGRYLRSLPHVFLLPRRLRG